MKHIKTIMNIQRTIKYIFIIIVICCYAGCQNKPCHNLQLVEELLDRDLLDSASNIFNSIDPSSIKSTSDSAYYSLMKTEIMWQKEEEIKNDSIISFSINYYEQNKDLKKLANAYHYKSGILYLQGKKKEAIYLEKKAELVAKTLHHDILNLKIYNNLSYFNLAANNKKEAEKYLKKILEISNKINNNLWKSVALTGLIDIHLDQNNIDSACYYINQATPLTKHLVSSIRISFLGNMGRFLEEVDPQKAISFYNEALRLEEDPKIYGFMANIYYKAGDVDKAMTLWNKSLNSPDISFQIEILQQQHQYLNEHDREHEAHQVAKRIIALKDSMAIIEQQDSIKEIQNMLEQEYMVQEAREERHMLIAICCGLIVTICIGIAIYTVRRRHYRKEISHHKNEALTNQEILRSLQQSSEQSAKDLKHLHKEMEMLRSEQSQLLAKGKQRYDEIMQGGNTALWHKQDFMAFMEYYRMIEPTFVEQQEKEYNTLSPKLQFFETVSHMGYSNKDIAQILCVGEDSLRSYKARVKKQKR